MRRKSYKEITYTLVRYLEKNGFVLGHRTGNDFLTVIHGIHCIKSESGFKKLKQKIVDKKLFGHILYFDAINATNDELKPIKALYSFVNTLKQMESCVYDIHNVIPRPKIREEKWVSGLFIGDKHIKESLDPNNYDDKYEGGFVQIMSDHKVPYQILEPDKVAKTIGIYVNYGARVVLKTEDLNINELNEQQKQILATKQLYKEEHKPISVLLLGGSFIWVEAVVEFHFNNRLLQQFCLPIKEFIRRHTNFYKTTKEDDPVPILILNKTKSTNWGIQIKPVIDGIYDQRIVTIEGPHNWKKGLTLNTWNQNIIHELLCQNNFTPNWQKQDSLSSDITSFKSQLVERKLELNIELNKDFEEIVDKPRSYSIEDFHKGYIYLYCLRKERKFTIMATSVEHSYKNIIAKAGPVFILEHSNRLDQLVFRLTQQESYGTFLFVIEPKELCKPLIKIKSKDDSSPYMKLQAFIIGKNDVAYNWKPFHIQDVLWKNFEDNVWFRGLVIGGIDVIRKKALKVLRKEPKSGNESESEESKNSKKRKKNENKDKIENKTKDSYEELMKSYRIRPNARKPCSKFPKLIETPKVIENWDYCQEIRTDFILPEKKIELPFDGEVSAIYIPEGVRCVLINKVLDEGKFDPKRETQQILDKRKLHPILLLHKTFLWIEGIVEMNLLEDIHLCYEPLEHSYLKQLIVDNHLIGEIEGVEYQEDLFGKILFLNPTEDENINWSIEVSPLIYPTFERRVIYLNIPIGGKVEIKDWDKAFEETIKDSNTQTNITISRQYDENHIKNFNYIPLKRWIDRDFKQKIYKFLDICINGKILIEIPQNYRRNALKTREGILNHTISCIKNYANLFSLFEHCSQEDIYWFFIRYQNFYLDHYGLMKFVKSKQDLFEIHFKHHFYDQFI